MVRCALIFQKVDCFLAGSLFDSERCIRAGRSRKTNKKIAIKHIDRVFQVKEDAIRILRELQFLRLLRHPNVSQLDVFSRVVADRVSLERIRCDQIIEIEDVLLPKNGGTFNDV